MINQIQTSFDSGAKSPLPPILLVQTGTPPDSIKAVHGDLPVWFGHALDMGEEAFQVVKVYLGEPLPAPDPDRVAIITGSWDMVTDKLPWSEYTAQWIRDAVDQGMPLFGVCYGHQLMAHALGGRVDYHPQGREMGCLDIRVTTQGHTDPFTAALSQGFQAYLTHFQTVIQPPTGAQVLASSAHDKHQIIRYGKQAISTQFHPEITAEIATSLIDLAHQKLLDEGRDPQEMQRLLRPAPESQALLQAFVHHYIRQPLPGSSVE